MDMFDYTSKIVDSIETNFCAELVYVEFDRENGKVTMTLNLHPECNPHLKKEDQG